MTLTRPRPSETSIAALARDALIARHAEFSAGPLDWRSELYLTTPVVGQFPIDMVYRCTDALNETFGAVECKFRLDLELKEQIDRLAGYVNYRWVAFEQRKAVMPWTKCKGLHPAIGIIITVDNTAEVVRGATYVEADTRLIAQAFASGDPALDPPAGIAAAKRQTQARAQWTHLRTYLQGIAPLRAEWSEIQNDVPAMRMVTSAQAVKAIDKKECLNVDYSESAAREFWAC